MEAESEEAERNPRDEPRESHTREIPRDETRGRDQKDILQRLRPHQEDLTHALEQTQLERL